MSRPSHSPVETVAQGEFALIDWIRRQSQSNPRVPLGIGDDAAIVSLEQTKSAIVTTDLLMDGRHFRLDGDGREAVGYKALAVNLSDIAAMAGRPLAAFVSVALPRREAVSIAQGLLRGMMPLAQRFGIALAGGDTNAWEGPLVVCVTVLGEPVPPGPALRSGAQLGDAILVTGPLGGSLLGRHLRPQPRIDEAQTLNRSCELHSLIDLSDGLSSDLPHILTESGGLGATLFGDRIPIHEDARILAVRDHRSALFHALNDGEDFELCLTVAPALAEQLLADPPAGVQLFQVGIIEREPGLRLRDSAGALVPLPPGGFDHLRSESS